MSNFFNKLKITFYTTLLLNLYNIDLTQIDYSKI